VADPDADALLSWFDGTHGEHERNREGHEGEQVCEEGHLPIRLGCQIAMLLRIRDNCMNFPPSSR
jgi:hypothetical protein